MKKIYITKLDITLKIRPTKLIAIDKAMGRVLSEDIITFQQIPPVEISAIKGYALNVYDLDYLPLYLSVVVNKAKKIGPGQAIFVQVGDEIPEGANAVIDHSSVIIDNDFIVVNKYVSAQENIINAGIDIEKDQIILHKNTKLNSSHLAIADISQVKCLPVYKKPRIGIVSQDNEGNYNPNYSIFRRLLFYFIDQFGGKPISVPFEKNAIKAGDDYQVVVMIGEHQKMQDNMAVLFGDNIAQVEFKMVNKKLSLAVCNKMIILALTGDHTLSLLASLEVLYEVILKMLDNYEDFSLFDYAILDRDLDVLDTSNQFLYAKYTRELNGKITVIPIPAQDLLLTSVVAESNCFILVDQAKKYLIGTKVPIIKYVD